MGGKAIRTRRLDRTDGGARRIAPEQRSDPKLQNESCSQVLPSQVRDAAPSGQRSTVPITLFCWTRTACKSFSRQLPNIGPLFATHQCQTSALHCDPPAPQFGAEESSNIALWSREESRQVNCFAVAKPGNAGGRAGARSGLGASRIRDFYSLFGWLPKLDRIAIWIFKPRKGPH